MEKAMQDGIVLVIKEGMKGKSSEEPSDMMESMEGGEEMEEGSEGMCCPKCGCKLKLSAED